MADTTVNLENKTAEELLGEGIRAYIVTYYDQAIAMLSKACELLVAEHQSHTHPSLGEAYLYYGKSLLEQARVEAEALGDGVPKNAEDNSDEEDLEPEENEGSPEEEKPGLSKDEAPKRMEDDSKEGETEPEANADSTNEQPGDKPGPSGATTDGDPTMEVEQEDGDGETNDLQLAWEVLELAKQIFLGQGDDGRKNLAEALIALAEVSLENGNFEAAIGDMNEGLRVQRLIFGKDSRTIAETCFKLGVAYSMNMKIDDAVKSFNDSLQCLKNRIGKLEMQQEKTDEVTAEIKEIRQFVPDIVEKIAEMKSYKDDMLQKLISAAASGGAGEASSSSSSSSVSSPRPANDISHLVKRKRKLDTIAEEMQDDGGAKRPNTGNN